MFYTADAHCDTLLGAQRGTVSHCITPELLKAGGVGLQTFAMFNGAKPPLPNGIERALDQLSRLAPLGFSLCTGTLPEALSEEPVAICSIEGSEILQDSLEALRDFRDRGVRLLNLTWNHDNTAGTPAFLGEGHLKPFGRTLVREMNAMGILADVSHLNVDGFMDVLELSTLPVVASHSCARALASHCRNLTDEQIRLLIEADGFMGINFCPEFLNDSGKASLDDIVRHVDHVAQMGGIRILGMGSDFDGISSTPEGMESAACFPALWARLQQLGYSDSDIQSIAGNNFLRVLKAAEVNRHA